MKSCKIIYGYVEKCLDDTTSPVLLIEPRSNIIDFVKKYIVNNKVNNVTLISKGLTNSNSMTESLLYYDKNLDKYWMNSYPVIKYGIVNSNPVKKYGIFTTSLSNIIIQYEIQNVESVVINLTIDNYNDIFENINPFNHIISRILICKGNSETALDHLLFNNYNCKQDQDYFHLKYLNSLFC